MLRDTYMVHPLERSICTMSVFAHRFGTVIMTASDEEPADVDGARASVSAISGPLDGV